MVNQMAESFDSFNKGWEMQKEKRMVEAIHCYELAKILGHTGAGFHLHMINLYGQGIPKKAYHVDWDALVISNDERDHLLSCYEELWFEPEIQHNMGCLYYCTKAYRKALQWWSLAGICNGYSHSLKSLGDLYVKGLFVKKDIELACKYYKRSILQNNYHAMCALGRMYYDGEEVPRDYKKAYEHFLLAAEQDHFYGQYMVGFCYEYGQGVKQDMDQALIWYTRVSDKNFCGSLMGLARTHKANESLHCYWLTLAAEQGYTNAQNSLGSYYHSVKQYDMALYWSTQSANQNNSVGQLNVGVHHYHGYGVDKDYDKAYKLWVLASQNGNISSRKYLGKFYEEINQNYDMAYLWYSLAPTDEYASNKIKYFEDLDFKISRMVKSYKPSKISSYIDFADLIKYLNCQLQPIIISDPLIKSSIIEHLVKQGQDGALLVEWFDAMF